MPPNRLTVSLCALCITILTLVPTGPVQAGPVLRDNALYLRVKALDAKLFDAYNTCDLAMLDDLVDANLEFYHDQSGLMTGKAAFVDAVRNNICNKVERRLVEDAFEVYPLASYGAIETGEHTFCNKVETPVCDDKTNGIGRFFMLWQEQADGAWRLTRVISYDHLSDWQRNPH